MIELRHFRYFVVLAEELHFGRAAQKLHIAQPGLSQQIQTLEAELGVSLLARTRRHVELTTAGRFFLQESRRILAQVQRAENLARRAGSGEIGRLTVAGTESATWDVLPELLREYRQRYSEVELVIREMTTPLQVAALHSGEIDVAFLRAPVNTEGLTAHTVRREPFAVLLPEAHPLARRAAIPLTALASEPLVVYPASPRPSWADVIIGVCRHAGFEPRVIHEASETATAVSFVAAGLGFVLVPEALKGLVRPGVLYRPLASPAPVTRLLLVHRSGEPSPTLKTFLAIAHKLWPQMK